MKKNDEEGEVMEFMKDMEKESKSMMDDLAEIDNALLSLKERIEDKRADTDEIIKVIDKIRSRIGVVEREDKRELDEEEVAETLLDKLKRWVDQIV